MSEQYIEEFLSETELLLETPVQRRIRARLNAPGSRTRVWRNNVGARKIQGRWLRWGLVKGSGDLIGLNQVLITPEMVGTVIGQFLSVECKRTKGGVLSDEQRIWAETVRRFGGVAEIWNDEQLAVEFLRGK